MDYYELAGVDRAASREAIDRNIRDQLRRWQHRSSSADLERRQEAERRVRQLAEARATLLDEEKRRRYDRELAALEPDGDQAPARERGRFETLPEPIPPADWVEEMPADARYEPPESRIGSPYGI